MARLRAGRPADLAAKAFFEEESYRRDWKTLPERLGRLAQALETWVRKKFVSHILKLICIEDLPQHCILYRL